MINENTENLKILLPSSGSLAEGSIKFLAERGIEVQKESDRKLIGEIKGHSDVEIFFQRSGDIPLGVDRGMGHLGITGLDRYLEHCEGSENSYVLRKNLMFGNSNLIVAVPNAWIDVVNVSDLIEVSHEFKNKSRNLRLATKYPSLVRRRLDEFGVTNVVLVASSGGLEAAPIIGYADIIADITVTGNTMKENNLRPLTDGILFESQATFISTKYIPDHLISTANKIIKKVNI